MPKFPTIRNTFKNKIPYVFIKVKLNRYEILSSKSNTESFLYNLQIQFKTIINQLYKNVYSFCPM